MHIRNRQSAEERERERAKCLGLLGDRKMEGPQQASEGKGGYGDSRSGHIRDRDLLLSYEATAVCRTLMSFSDGAC